MLPIQQMYIHVNQFSRPGTPLKNKRGIVLHYTGDRGAPARNIDEYFDSLRNQDPNASNDTFASAQYAVDRYNIVEVIPSNEMAYHCGSATYTQEALDALGSYPNNSTVGIEMCIEDDGSIHEDTFQNAADLVVWLIKEQGFPEVLFTHKGVVGWKDCPLPWVQNPSEFERFKQVVHNKLTGNPQFSVFQGQAHLGDFYTYADAVAEAQKWANSYVAEIATGNWVWSNIPNQTNTKEVPKLDDATKQNAYQAIDYLASKGLLNSPDYWKAQVEQAMPVWAYMIIEARKAGDTSI
jgi:N-acetylmuramoyl-L-alanine amidase